MAFTKSHIHSRVVEALSTVPAVLFLLLCLVFASKALGKEDVTYWIKRIQQASANQSYYGEIQYYRIGQPIKSLEFAHLGKGNYSHELLRGPFQGLIELIRSDDGVMVYAINQKQDVKNIRLLNQPSLQWLSDSQAEVIAKHYELQTLGTATVAGRKTQAIALKPVSKDRHEYRAWLDIETGILMGSSRRNEVGDIVESFYFLRFKTGADVQAQLEAYYNVMSRTQGKPVFAPDNEADINQPVGQRLTFSYLPSGFTEVEELRRQVSSKAKADQWVFSDGLNTISVFFKPLSSGAKPGVISERRGANSIAVRHTDNCEIVVVGEVPLEIAKKIVNGVDHQHDK